jgi:hypothetical protein
LLKNSTTSTESERASSHATYGLMRKQVSLFLILLVLVVPVIYWLTASQTRSMVIQPVAFPHKVHAANQIECVFCHAGVEIAEQAGIPSVSQCMLCHQSTRTDSPEIQKLAAFAARHEEVPWVRIYTFEKPAAVRFSHKRHVKADVDCSVCHGDVAEATEMRREIIWTMGKCIDCHRSKQASIDCLVCHK